MSINGYSVKVFNDGEVKIYAQEETLEEGEILVLAKYLFDEGFIHDDEEISINVVPK